jgi:hypothetical protein
MLKPRKSAVAKNATPQKRVVSRGTFGVEVDGKESQVSGVKKTIYRNDGTVRKSVFKAKGVGSSPVNKIREVNKYKKPTDNVKKTPAERKVALKKVGKKALNVVKGAAIPVAAMITLKKYSK